MKLKVCGLSRKKEIITCINHEVEFCGLILNYPKSHRHITFSRARELIKIKRKKTKFVGVLVNPTNKDLKKFSHLKLDYFQLYGKYDNSKLRLIKNKFKKKSFLLSSLKKRKMYKIIKKLRIIQILFYGIAQVMKKVLHGIMIGLNILEQEQKKWLQVISLSIN